MEIIIINDGSNDNSKELIKKYKYNEKIIVVNKENEGLTKTRNKGLEISRGKYIYFIDADDYLEKDEFILEKLYNKCEKENLDILVFDYFETTETGKNILSHQKMIKMY